MQCSSCGQTKDESGNCRCLKAPESSIRIGHVRSGRSRSGASATAAATISPTTSPRRSDSDVNDGTRRKWFVKKYSERPEDVAARSAKSGGSGVKPRLHTLPQAGKNDGPVDFRNRVIDEIVNTEIDYVTDLSVICEIYAAPLKDFDVISLRDYCRIFANVEQLLDTNVQVAELLSGDGGRDRVPHIFLSCAPSFSCYANYCSNQKVAFDTLHELQEKNKDLALLLEYCRMKPECGGLDLASFLVKPLQRICKYPLLLRELLKYTEETHSDYNLIKRAMSRMEAVVAMLNETNRRIEEEEKVIEIADKIVCQAGTQIVSRDRTFIEEKEVSVVADGKAKKRVTYFLFNDLLLLTKKKSKRFHLKAYLSFSDIVVQESKTGDDKMVEIHHSDGLCWSVLFSTADLCEAFLERISELIAEHLERVFSPPADEDKESENAEAALLQLAIAAQAHAPVVKPPTEQSIVDAYATMPRRKAPKPLRSSQKSVNSPPTSPRGSDNPSSAVEKDALTASAGAREREKARKAMRRMTVARGLADKYRTKRATMLLTRLRSDSFYNATSFNVAEFTVGEKDNVAVVSIYHDSRVTHNFIREDLNFLLLRRQIHEIHKIDTPRQFINLKVTATGQRIANQNDLVNVIGLNDSFEISVFV